MLYVIGRWRVYFMYTFCSQQLIIIIVYAKMENSLLVFCFSTKKKPSHCIVYTTTVNYKIFEVGRLKICEILLDFTIQPHQKQKENYF